MYSRKSNNQAPVGDQGTAAYTNMPAGARVGGTANYPSSQNVSGQKVGYGYEAGKDVNTANYPASQKAGYEYPQQSNSYGGDYVQPPVTYGPDGTPIYATKKSHRMRNLVVGALAVVCCCIVL